VANHADESEFDSIPLVGRSPAMQEIYRVLARLMQTDLTVMISGESGTGKELVARALHDYGKRRNGPFVAVNMAAIPRDLIESELFGHERGAFTGAWTQTTGRFQMADQGTLFLDEVGDLPLELQPKLLRILQEQEFERLGSSRTIRVDVRIVAATNVDLAQMVRERKFRADLYYRLNVFPITLPPLRERRDDIASLVWHFVRTFADRMGKEIGVIPDEVMDILKCYEWPGNIRELQNFIERSVILSSGAVLRPPLGDLKVFTRNAEPSSVRTLAEAERDHIVEAIRQAGGIVGGRRGAAANLGMARTTLLYRMRKLGIGQPETRTAAAGV
jgi:formate hydrogenlyase transcriptional activator